MQDSKTCDIAVDEFPLASKSVPDLFIMSNMIEKIHFVLSNDDIVFGDSNSDFVAFL